MSRRRKRTPATKTLAAFELEARKRLAEFLNAEDHSPNLLARVSQAISPKRGIQQSTVELWESNIDDAIESYPDVLSDIDAAETIYSYKLTGVFSEGMVTGECVDAGLTYKLYVQTGDLESPSGCSCAISKGFAPCMHAFYFLNKLFDELGNHYSQFYHILQSGRFESKIPEMKQFEFNPRAHIDLLLSQLVPREIPSDNAELPPVAEITNTRVVWDVENASNHLTVNPILQQAKKRGGGWTKGRRISLESLGNYAESMTAADLKVRQKTQGGNQYYRTAATLDPIRALECLIGADNVLLNGEPAEVSTFTLTFKFCSDANECWLQVFGMTAGQSMLLSDNTTFINVSDAQGTIQVCKLERAAADCVRAILKTPRIPLEFQSELLDKARELQQLLTIHLPDGLAGPLVADSVHPVLLLRSQANGILDYGVRIRNSDGKLCRPAQGVLVRRGLLEKKPVQLQRSAEGEHRMARQTLSHLGLSAEDYDGSLHDFEAAMNLLEQIESLANSDTEIVWDKTSEKPIRVLGTVTNKNVSVAITSKRDWFQLSGKCDFGNSSLELVDLLEALQSTDANNLRGEYVRVGDKGWTRIADDLRNQFQKLRDSVSQERRSLKFDATAAFAMRDLLDQNVAVKATAAWEKCLTRLEYAEQFEPKLPTGLQAALREYQVDGYRWLRRLAEWGVGGVLADDMGLGKTVQTIAVILDRADNGPTLVIAPTSVGFNWIRETEKFAPQLNAHLYRETDRGEFLKQLKPGALVVCSYGLALRDAEQLAQIQWANLVLDEAQAIKNSRSKTSLAIQTIPADWKIALTGTPVENHLGELWSLFHVVSPGVFGGWDQFRKRFATPIEKAEDADRKLALQQRLQPFVLRRTKKEVLSDLPPRSEMNLYVEFSPAERAIYDKVRQSAIGEIDQISNLNDVKDQRFRILAILTRLRQLACSPKLVHDSWTDRSAKLNLLCDTLKELKEEGHRVLIFSQFVKHLALIRTMLEEENITFEYLDGSTPAAARQTAVDRFQTGEATAFLISLKAGGTGLNLTAADYVIHMDPWWNPAVEDQATDRAHRMGQDKPVMVYRMIAKGSIEEEILKLHDTKRDLVAGVLEGTHSASKLSTADLIAMVRG